MKSNQWLVSERRRLRRGIYKIEREQRNVINVLPHVLKSDDFSYAKHLGKKLLALRFQSHSLSGRIKLLSKILREQDLQ